jgi:hypothetical protein
MPVIRIWQQSNPFPQAFHQLLRDEALLVVFQILNRLLLSQNENGSWGFLDLTRNTKLALQSITNVASLPMVQPLKIVIEDAILRGKNFIKTNGNVNDLNFSIQLIESSAFWESLDNTIEHTRLPKLCEFYQSLPLLAPLPEWILMASLIEGALFWPMLKSDKFMLLGIEHTKSKWFDFSTFPFTVCNNMGNHYISPESHLHILGETVLLYQIDYFIESIMAKKLVSRSHDIFLIIEEAFQQLDEWKQPLASYCTTASTFDFVLKPLTPSETSDDFFDAAPEKNNGSGLTGRQKAVDGIKLFVDRMMNDRIIATASLEDKKWYKTELKAFFIAQCVQVQESEQMATQNAMQQQPHFISNDKTFWRWQQTTGLDSVGSVYMFAGFCISTSTSLACFSSPLEKYVAQSLAASMSNMWRIENDVGGIPRDEVEGTVNGANFPEFRTGHGIGTGVNKRIAAEMRQIADYERQKWQHDLKLLQELSSEDQSKKSFYQRMGVLIRGFELWCQVYLAKDPWWKSPDE